MLLLRTFLLLSVSALALAQPSSQYVFSEAMVPTRDGVKLHTVLFTPKGQAEPLPFLFIRTPYLRVVPGAGAPFQRQREALQGPDSHLE